VDVCKDNTDIGAAVEDYQRVIGITGLYYRESSIFQHLDGFHPNDSFVFNN